MEKIGPISYELINQEVKTIDHYHWNRIGLFERGIQIMDGQTTGRETLPFLEENEKHWSRVYAVSQQNNFWYLDEDEYFSDLWANSQRKDLLSKFSETEDVGEMLEIYKGLISAHRVEVDYYRKR